MSAIKTAFESAITGVEDFGTWLVSPNQTLIDLYDATGVTATASAIKSSAVAVASLPGQIAGAIAWAPILIVILVGLAVFFLFRNPAIMKALLV